MKRGWRLQGRSARVRAWAPRLGAIAVLIACVFVAMWLANADSTDTSDRHGAIPDIESRRPLSVAQERTAKRFAIGWWLRDRVIDVDQGAIDVRDTATPDLAKLLLAGRPPRPWGDEQAPARPVDVELLRIDSADGVKVLATAVIGGERAQLVFVLTGGKAPRVSQLEGVS